jgi:glucose-1-phosphate cytidylyltransferase
MIEIGDAPILWHIMKYYAHYGYTEFIICCGYKGYMIKEYFADYYLHRSDVTFDFADGNKMVVHSHVAEPWKVTLTDTGLYTQTGGRIKRIRKYVEDETFLMTYGDGLSNVDIDALLASHRAGVKTVTLTAVRPEGRFGVLSIDNPTNTIIDFREKLREDSGWVNGGFMVMEPGIFEHIQDDAEILEFVTFDAMSRLGLLGAYRHDGFW